MRKNINIHMYCKGAKCDKWTATDNRNYYYYYLTNKY